MVASSTSQDSASEVSRPSVERDRDTAQKQLHLVNILAGVKRKRDGPASPGDQAIRVRVPRTNSPLPNHTREVPTPSPSGNPDMSPPNGPRIFATMEADADQPGDQGAEAENNWEESEDGSYDEVIEDESNDDDSDDPVHVELFGQEPAWKTILEGARMVGVSKAGSNRTQVLPPLKTKVIKSLVKNTQRAGNHFEMLINTRKEKDHERIEHLEKRLATKLEEIKEQVETLTEAAAGIESSETITDIFAHAIPILVETLRWGFLSQTEYYSRPTDFEKLESIISVQDSLLLLCKKARSWNAKTDSFAPIRKVTTQKIFPYLRDLREAFADVYEERKRLWQSEQSQSLLIESHERLHEKRQLQRVENARQQEKKRQIMARDLDQRYKVIFGRKRNVPFKKPSEPLVLERPSKGGASVTNEWTSDQDRALLIQLMEENIRHLPGTWTTARSMLHLTFRLAKQRYLATLNTPLLQNKLPEHIRERALYFKDALEVEWGDRDFVKSIE